MSPVKALAMGCTVITGLSGGLSWYKRAHWFWRGSTGTLTLSTAGTPAASSLVLFRNSLAPVVALALAQAAAPTRQSAGRLHKPGSESSRPGGRRCLWGPETTGQQTSLTPRCISSVLCHRVSRLMGSEQNQSDNINHVTGKIIRGAIKDWVNPFPHPPTYST